MLEENHFHIFHCWCCDLKLAVYLPVINHVALENLPAIVRCFSPSQKHIHWVRGFSISMFDCRTVLSQTIPLYPQVIDDFQWFTVQQPCLITPKPGLRKIHENTPIIGNALGPSSGCYGSMVAAAPVFGCFWRVGLVGFVVDSYSQYSMLPSHWRLWCQNLDTMIIRSVLGKSILRLRHCIGLGIWESFSGRTYQNPAIFRETPQYLGGIMIPCQSTDGHPKKKMGAGAQESREFVDPEPADPAFVNSLKPIPSPRVPWGAAEWSRGL